MWTHTHPGSSFNSIKSIFYVSIGPFLVNPVVIVACSHVLMFSCSHVPGPIGLHFLLKFFRGGKTTNLKENISNEREMAYREKRGI